MRMPYLHGAPFRELLENAAEALNRKLLTTKVGI
jgi:hypothetical protein